MENKIRYELDDRKQYDPEKGCGKDIFTEKKGCVFCGDSEGYFCDQCLLIQELTKKLEMSRAPSKIEVGLNFKKEDEETTLSDGLFTCKCGRSGYYNSFVKKFIKDVKGVLMVPPLNGYRHYWEPHITALAGRYFEKESRK